MEETVQTGLSPLSQLDEYEVAEGCSDIRGWPLYDETGRAVGVVKDLLVDTIRDQAVYATIEFYDKALARDLFGADVDARVPLAAVTLDREVKAIGLTQPLATLADWRAAGVADVEREAAPGPTAGPELAPGEVAAASEADTVDVLEEQAGLKTRRKEAGEVRVTKDVETETVRRTVPVEREEVIVERERVDRELAPGEAAAGLESREGEVVIPVYREEVEVTRRLVLAERLRIRKRSVREQREVAAEVRTEHVRVEGEGTVGEGGRPGSEAGGIASEGDLPPERELSDTPPKAI
jgi:uncharacterized protein (TIGR02271 family)